MSDDPGYWRCSAPGLRLFLASFLVPTLIYFGSSYALDGAPIFRAFDPHDPEAPELALYRSIAHLLIICAWLPVLFAYALVSPRCGGKALDDCRRRPIAHPFVPRACSH